MQQVKHAVETGALRPGEQLPGIRPLAEELVVSVNTIAKAYRELEHEGVIELRHGAGAFIAQNADLRTVSRSAQSIVATMIERLRSRGLTDDEIRRLIEAHLTSIANAGVRRG